MPGSSLWLVPPESHPLHGIITSLITDILPRDFPAEAGGGGDGDGDGDGKPVLFAPHMTLTSEISPSAYGCSTAPNSTDADEQQERRKAQAWLDSLPFPPEDQVSVRLESVDTQDVFFRRCFVRVGFPGVRDVVAVAREHGVVRPGRSAGAGSGDGHGNANDKENNDEAGISGTTEEWLRWWREAFGPHVSLIYGKVPITEARLAKISKIVEDSGISLSLPNKKDNDTSSSSGRGIAGWQGGVVWLVPTDRSIPEWKPIATRTL